VVAQGWGPRPGMREGTEGLRRRLGWALGQRWARVRACACTLEQAGDRACGRDPHCACGRRRGGNAVRRALRSSSAYGGGAGCGGGRQEGASLVSGRSMRVRTAAVAARSRSKCARRRRGRACVAVVRARRRAARGRAVSGARRRWRRGRSGWRGRVGLCSVVRRGGAGARARRERAEPGRQRGLTVRLVAGRWSGCEGGWRAAGSGKRVSGRAFEGGGGGGAAALGGAGRWRARARPATGEVGSARTGSVEEPWFCSSFTPQRPCRRSDRCAS